MEIAYSASPNIGKFNIPHETLHDGGEAPMLKALFGLCVILHTEQHESGRGMTYVAASELFQPLREREEIPEYRIEFGHLRPLPDAELEARAIASANFRFAAVRQVVIRVPPAQTHLSPRLTH